MKGPWHRALAALGLLLGTFNAGFTASSGWTQEAYLWQRIWTPQVLESLRNSQETLDGIHILAAEISWNKGAPKTLRISLDYPTLQSLTKPITLVIRIAPYYGSFSSTDSNAQQIVSLAQELLRNAKEKQLHISELQIDFDCAESRLSGYREWLHALRQNLAASDPSIRLSFTSLPAWLRHKEDFRKLAQESDGFILQVHSLEKPNSYDDPITLCDPERSLKWAAQASEIGKPFRIALPTYGYEVAFDKSGKFFALSAEGPRPNWSEDVRIRVVRADPEEMAHLAQKIAANSSPNCAGIIWFRLPVSGDRLNWSTRTLEIILKGDIPQNALCAGTAWSESGDGLARIFLENTGDTPQPFPKTVSVKWTDQAPISWDSMGLFSMTLAASRQSACISTEALSPSASIAPGQRIALAWIRFSKPISIYTEYHNEP